MIEIAGLASTSEDEQGRTYFKATRGRLEQTSQYNAQQYRIKGIDGFWESSTALEVGRVYLMALTAKFKTGPNARPGSMYLDIRSAELDDSIPAEQPTPQQATSGNGGHSQDEFRRSKEEVRWTEACHMATRMALGDKAEILEWARWFYAELASPPTDSPSEPENEDEDEMPPPQDYEEEDGLPL